VASAPLARFLALLVASLAAVVFAFHRIARQRGGPPPPPTSLS
jgi:hypothetical protein